MLQGGKRVSAIVEGKAMVVYTPGEWAYPPEWLREAGFPLMAFEILGNARNFAFINYCECFSLEIWEIEYMEFNSNCVPFCRLAELSRGETVQGCRDTFPPRTVFCEKIKLVKRCEP